jgi:hypothetical protein
LSTLSVSRDFIRLLVSACHHQTPYFHQSELRASSMECLQLQQQKIDEFMEFDDG